MFLRLIFCSLSIIISCSVSLADNSQGNAQKPGLSHLYFDEHLGSEKRQQREQERLELERRKMQASEEARQKLELEKQQKLADIVTFEEGPDVVAEYPLLVPRLGDGPITDGADIDKLTSKVAWERKGASSCASSGELSEFALKSAALQEVLKRFSGNSEFFEAHCKDPRCQDLGRVGVPHSLELTDPFGTKLKLIDRVEECRWSLVKPPEVGWRVVSVSEVSCLCVTPQMYEVIISQSVEPAPGQ